MKIVVIGTGYVGLVTGVCFASTGFNVTCVDKNAEKIANLKQGIIPIYEPGLEELLDESKNNITFTTDLSLALKDADVIFIAVGTPLKPEDGSADLRYVFTATEEILKYVSPEKYTVLVTKSTVPVGTGKKLQTLIKEMSASVNIDVVSNPEFLKEGSAIEDCLKPDRIVVGADSRKALSVMKKLYALYTDNPLVLTTLESAELIKYAANSFLALKVTFINEIANLCEETGADVQDISKGIGLDHRIGSKFLNAGPGYGGSCFPKDTQAFVNIASQHNVSLSLVEATIKSNDRRKQKMAEKIIAACGGNIANKKITVLGITFKPNTDDVRDAPSLTILPMLQQAGAILHVYDPAGTHEAKKYLENIVWHENAYDAVLDAEGVIILTEWNEFSNLDFEKMKNLMKHPLLIDLRNMFVSQSVRDKGFQYVSIGRS